RIPFAASYFIGEHNALLFYTTRIITCCYLTSSYHTRSLSHSSRKQRTGPILQCRASSLLSAICFSLLSAFWCSPTAPAEENLSKRPISFLSSCTIQRNFLWDIVTASKKKLLLRKGKNTMTNTQIALITGASRGL